MIGDIIDILKDSTGPVFALVPSTHVFPIQRKQGSGVPAITVDLLDVKTNETKRQTSEIDFMTIQVIAYDDNPRDSFNIAQACRSMLDGHSEAITDGVMDIRFEDIETGIIPDEDVFATITQFVVSVKRTAQGRYN